MGIITKDADSGEKADVEDSPFAEGQSVVHDDENYDNKGVQPLLLDGTRVKVRQKDGPDRMAVIVHTTFASPEDSFQFHNAFGQDRMFAGVEYYTVKTRDSRNETLIAKPSEVRQLGTNEGWARGES